MKGFIPTAFLLVTLPQLGVAGDCTGGGGTAISNVTATLNDKTVCGAADNGDTWQEWHTSGGGEVWEYALGDGHPVDPRHHVANWSARNGTAPNPGRVTYSYLGGSSYTFELWQNGSTLYFCGSGSTNTTKHAYASLPLLNGVASCN